VVVSLSESPAHVAQLLAGTQGVLLPGSRFDVDPERFGEPRLPACGPADPARTAVDELLLQDAFNLHKPIFGICHGAQGLNVWCNGTLYQDLPSQIGAAVNHSPGRTVADAHPIAITPGTRLATIQAGCATVNLCVNSSHHQAIHTVGDNLRVAALSPADGIVEAVELDSSDHYVLAVQWHPERTYAENELSRALFANFVRAAQSWQPRRIEESVVKG
jgi:putative glutamine amidotransferase